MKWLWLISGIVTGCASQHTILETRVVATSDSSLIETREILEESIDPYVIYQPWKNMPNVKMTRDIQANIIHDWIFADSSVVRKDGPVIGFRVQLYATKDYYEAVTRREEASERFDEVVHMDFDPPYYKIRVGDFTQRNDAEQARLAAKEAGYPDAWIVRTLIARNDNEH